MSDSNDKKKYLGYLWLLSDDVLEDIRSQALENPGGELLVAIDTEIAFRKERRKRILDVGKSREELGLDSLPLPLNIQLPQKPPGNPADIHDKVDE